MQSVPTHTRQQLENYNVYKFTVWVLCIYNTATVYPARAYINSWSIVCVGILIYIVAMYILLHIYGSLAQASPWAETVQGRRSTNTIIANSTNIWFQLVITVWYLNNKFSISIASLLLQKVPLYKCCCVGKQIKLCKQWHSNTPTSLIPRSLPDFILQLSLQLQDKIWEWPGDKAILQSLFSVCARSGEKMAYQGLFLSWGQILYLVSALQCTCECAVSHPPHILDRMKQSQEDCNWTGSYPLGNLTQLTSSYS